MGLSHTILFSKEQNEIATITQALGHPARVAIMELLTQNKCLQVNEIVERLPLSQPTISQHLQKLMKAKIINSKCGGRSNFYCLNKQYLQKHLISILQHFSTSSTNINETCKLIQSKG